MVVPLLLAALPSLLHTGGCRAAAPTHVATVGGRTIMGLPAYGLRAATVAPGVLTFTAREEWLKFWSLHRDGTVPAPEVDFSQWMIVAVFRGARPNPGYGVEVTRGDISGGEIVLSVVDWLPDPSTGYSAVVVYPFDLVAVPAGYRVRLSEERRRRDGTVSEKELPLTLVRGGEPRPSTSCQWVVFTDAQAWRRFWQAQGQSEAPVVDFSTSAVAGVVGDPAVRGIARVTQKGDVVRLQVEATTAPAPEGKGSAMLCIVPAAPRISFTLQIVGGSR